MYYFKIYNKNYPPFIKDIFVPMNGLAYMLCNFIPLFLLNCFLPVKGNQLSTAPGSPLSVFGSLGLKDFELNQNGSELAAKLHGLLTGVDFHIGSSLSLSVDHLISLSE